MPRQNIMAFAPVKLTLLAVLLVQVASARYDLVKDGASDDGSPFQSLAGVGGPKATQASRRVAREVRRNGGLAGLGEYFVVPDDYYTWNYNY